jgi:hypothetical protein
VADIDLMHLRHTVLCACGTPLAPIAPGPRNAKQPTWQDTLCPSCRQSAVASTLVTRRVLSELVADERGYALHRRLLPDGSTVDHLFVGEAAVHVISVVSGHDGEVLVERTGGRFAAGTEALTVGGRRRTELVDAVRSQSAAVASGLADHGHGQLPVVPVLCFLDAHLARRARHRHIGDVRLVSPATMGDEVAAHGLYDGDRRFAVAMSLVSFLPATT